MQSTSDLVLQSAKDQLFEGSSYPIPFDFNGAVANVFDDMASRSIPLYQNVTVYLAEWVKRYYIPGTRVYDIGCSTGTTLINIAQILDDSASLIGIDKSSDMLARAQDKLDATGCAHRIQLINEDARFLELKSASVVILNYTLQFLPPEDRVALLNKIFSSLEPGGILFISEKTRLLDPKMHKSVTDIYENFKHKQGYSHKEIARKKAALEKVLLPYTESELREKVHNAGFSYCESVMKWNQFVSLVAVKGELC